MFFLVENFQAASAHIVCVSRAGRRIELALPNATSVVRADRSHVGCGRLTRAFLERMPNMLSLHVNVIDLGHPLELPRNVFGRIWLLALFVL